MAFVNDEGKSISYDCGVYMEWLQDDIKTMGGDALVDVAAIEMEGVTIYKAYAPHGQSLKLQDGEYLQTMTASALMVLYETENGII